MHYDSINPSYTKPPIVMIQLRKPSTKPDEFVIVIGFNESSFWPAVFASISDNCLFFRLWCTVIH